MNETVDRVAQAIRAAHYSAIYSPPWARMTFAARDEYHRMAQAAIDALGSEKD